MRVELALFDGDELLGRNELSVGHTELVSAFSLFRASHKLSQNAAEILLSNFPDHIDLTTVSLDMPIHESTDWESIDVGRYTLAFWCRLEA